MNDIHEKVEGVLGFLVSWSQEFLVFKASWFQSFLFSWFRSFKDLSSIPCFLEDLDPTSKIFKNLLNGPAGFVGARLFFNFQNIEFPKC